MNTQKAPIFLPGISAKQYSQYFSGSSYSRERHLNIGIGRSSDFSIGSTAFPTTIIYSLTAITKVSGTT